MASIVESCVVCTDAICSTLGTCTHYVHRKCVLTSGKEECPLCKVPITNVTRAERKVLKGAARSLETYNRANAEQLIRDAMDEEDEEEEEEEEEQAMFEQVMDLLGMAGIPPVRTGWSRSPVNIAYQIRALDASSHLHQVMLQPCVAKAIFHDVNKPVYVNGLVPGMQVCFFPDSMRLAVRTTPCLTVDLSEVDVEVAENVEGEDED